MRETWTETLSSQNLRTNRSTHNDGLLLNECEVCGTGRLITAKHKSVSTTQHTNLTLHNNGLTKQQVYPFLVVNRMYLSLTCS